MNAVQNINNIQHKVLHSQNSCDNILVSRKDLEVEHRQLLSRVQQLRRLLGYPPLPTGKQQRMAQATE
jgi:hypothetical protein